MAYVPSRKLPVVIDGLTAPEAFGRLVFAGQVIAELRDDGFVTAGKREAEYRAARINGEE